MKELFLRVKVLTGFVFSQQNEPCNLHSGGIEEFVWN